MPRITYSLFVSCLLAIAAAQARADGSFPGQYTGQNLSIEIIAAAESFTGTIHLGQQSYPLKAKVIDGKLSGVFTANSHDFPFTTTLNGDNLTLTTGTTTYQLARNPANPLDVAPPPANPLDQPAPPTAAPAGYRLVAATDLGSALTTKKPSINKVADALESTLHDLATFLGNKPSVNGAFEDTKDHQSGSASFTATQSGQPIKGLITCRLADNAAEISVIFCRATATPDDWKKLTSAASAPTPPAQVPAPDIKLTTFQFPDGTGTIGLADGWQVHSASLVDALNITGPGGQTIGGGSSIPVQNPDSPLVLQAQQMQKNNDDSWRRMGRQPPPPLPSAYIVAAMADPDQALPIVVPQYSAMTLRYNKTAAAIDNITVVKSVPPIAAGGKSQILQYGVTRTANGVTKHTRVKAQWESDTIQNSPGGWMLFLARSLEAPDDTFDHDLLTMQAMLQSIKIDQANYMKVEEAQFEARMKANNQAFQANIAAHQAQMKQQAEAFEEHNRQWAVQENQKSRNADDWIEYAGGYRTVIDTQTGQKAGVDLSNVNGIVNSLNESANDPNRFVQIPLRDERDPTINP